MKLSRLFALTAILAAASLLAGCSIGHRPPRPPVVDYTLEYAPPVFENPVRLPAVVRVDQFDASPVINTRQMVYRDQAFTANTYFYHRWRANPSELATFFLARDMAASGLFSAAVSYDAPLPVTHAVQGLVTRFDEQDLENGWEAVIEVTVTLYRPNDPDAATSVLFQKTYRQSAKARLKNPQGVADAMSQAMKAFSRQLIADIHQTLTDHTSKEGQGS